MTWECIADKAWIMKKKTLFLILTLKILLTIVVILTVALSNA